MRTFRLPNSISSYSVSSYSVSSYSVSSYSVSSYSVSSYSVSPCSPYSPYSVPPVSCLLSPTRASATNSHRCRPQRADYGFLSRARGLQASRRRSPFDGGEQP